MRRWCAVCLFGVVVASGCSKERNPRACLDGICPDLAYPFCDIDGSLEGSPKTCIAVDCEPQSLVACRGDEELRCNADGTNYSIFQCARGCEDATGCRLCDPNETACTNGKLATCDASGAVVSSEACPLGCFEDQPRCREIDPSNGLGTYLDMVADPPDVVLSSGTLNTRTGALFDGSSSVVVPSFLAPGSSTGVPIRVLVANKVTIRDLSVTADPDEYGGPALAIVARDAIAIEGRISIDGSAGSVANASCNAGMGDYWELGATGTTQVVAGGTGGGGHATSGGAGGSVSAGGYSPAAGGRAGDPVGNEALVPLRGGCAAGGAKLQFENGRPTSENAFSTLGGGAIQLTSRISISISGVIDARGRRGEQLQGSSGAYMTGGGAGGGILLEAPVVTLGNQGKLIAKGGAGGSTGYPPPPPTDTIEQEIGTPCSAPGPYCTAGGHGAAPGAPAKSAENAAYTNSSSVPRINAGGGGGGLGRIRINTSDQTYIKANSTIEAGAVSTGTLSTR